jgi:SAM-dependent methyltransferase
MAPSASGRSIPSRARWAVERLALVGDERVLEVGCGAGAAAELVGERLTTGRLVAIDRSASMVERAIARNRALVDAGTLLVRPVPLVEIDRCDGPFDLAFAIDVNVFGGACEAELERLSEVMVEGGTLHLVHRPPPGKVEGFAHNLRRVLPAAGYEIEDLSVDELDEGRVLGVRAVRT